MVKDMHQGLAGCFPAICYMVWAVFATEKCFCTSVVLMLRRAALRKAMWILNKFHRALGDERRSLALGNNAAVFVLKRSSRGLL